MALTRTNEHARSLVEIANNGYDREFNIPAVEQLSYNPVSNSLERVSTIQGNSSLVLSYDGSGNLTTLAKTVGSTTYTKTLTYTDGNLTAVSDWSTT